MWDSGEGFTRGIRDPASREADAREALVLQPADDLPLSVERPAPSSGRGLVEPGRGDQQNSASYRLTSSIPLEGKTPGNTFPLWPAWSIRARCESKVTPESVVGVWARRSSAPALTSPPRPMAHRGALAPSGPPSQDPRGFPRPGSPLRDFGHRVWQSAGVTDI